MSGLSVMRIVRPAVRSLMVSPQLQSQMVVRMMSSQKELQYIKVDTTGIAVLQYLQISEIPGMIFCE